MSIIKGGNLYSLEVYFQFCFEHVHTQYAEGFVNLKEPHIQQDIDPLFINSMLQHIQGQTIAITDVVD